MRRAYEAAGAVTDEAGRYLNKRDRLHSSNQIMAIDGDYADNERSSLAVCLDTIFQYEGMVKNSSSLLAAGQDDADDSGRKFRQSDGVKPQGCTLDMVLYYPLTGKSGACSDAGRQCSTGDRLQRAECRFDGPADRNCLQKGHERRAEHV